MRYLSFIFFSGYWVSINRESANIPTKTKTRRPSIPLLARSRLTHHQEYMLPDMFKGWDIFVAESPVLPESHPLFFTSPWTASCNVLLLDEKRVVCEASEEPTIRRFEEWGFDVVKVRHRTTAITRTYYGRVCNTKRPRCLRTPRSDLSQAEWLAALLAFRSTVCENKTPRTPRARL